MAKYPKEEKEQLIEEFKNSGLKLGRIDYLFQQSQDW